jgi:hypothetical protein
VKTAQEEERVELIAAEARHAPRIDYRINEQANEPQVNDQHQQIERMIERFQELTLDVLQAQRREE